MSQISADQFVRLVRESKLLTSVQKRELLDRAHVWPKNWLERIVEIVVSYENNARDREDTVRMKAEEVYKTFEQKLDNADLPPETRQKLLMKARGEIEMLFPTSPNA